MDGPTHFRAAEKLLHDIDESPWPGTVEQTEALAAAQVHATLALAAATIDAPAAVPDVMDQWAAATAGGA